MGRALDGRKLPRGITQMPSGLYQGRVTYSGQTEAIYNRSLSELKKQMTDLRYQLEHGTFVKESDMIVSDWFKEWINVYKKPCVKQGTILSYEKHYSAYLKDEIGNIKLKDLRASHLQKALNKIAEKGYSDNTIELAYCVLSGMCKQAYKSELIAKNPFSVITRPRGAEPKGHICFTKEEQALYMEYSERYYLKNFLQLAILTGMRVGELGGLQWCDCDFKNKTIHIRHTLRDNGKLDTPKTRTSLRDIPMLPQAEEILRDQEREYKEMIGGNIVKISNNDFVFSVCGEPISKKRVTFIINKMIEDIRADGYTNFPDFTMHTTRHSFATRCLEAGMQPQTLKAILGHATLSMTVDLYGHVLDNQKQEEMEKVQDAFKLRKAE